MKVKQLLALVLPIAALSSQAHASANLSGVVGATVVQSSAVIAPRFSPIIPCAPSPENATVLLVLFGAVGLLAGYQLRRTRRTETAPVR